MASRSLLPLCHFFFSIPPRKHHHMRRFLLHNHESEPLEERPVLRPGALTFLKVSRRNRTIFGNYKNDKTFPGVNK